MASCAEWVNCPYDKAHRVLKSRIQIHICKEHGETLKANKRICEYNSTHIVDEMEYQYHKVNCPDAVSILEQRYRMERERKVGNVTLEEIREMSSALPSSEDWDNAPMVSSTYDPLKNIANRNVLRQPVGLSKAKRKQFRVAEREKFRHLEDNTSNIPNPVSIDKTIETPLRRPISKPVCESPKKQVPKMRIEDELARLLFKRPEVEIQSDNVSVTTETSTSSDTEVETESNTETYDTEDCKSNYSFSTIQSDSAVKDKVESEPAQSLESIYPFASTQNDIINEFNERLNILARAQENIELEKQKLIEQFTETLKFVSTHNTMMANSKIKHSNPSSSTSEPNLVSSKSGLGPSLRSLN